MWAQYWPPDDRSEGGSSASAVNRGQPQKAGPWMDKMGTEGTPVMYHFPLTTIKTLPLLFHVLLCNWMLHHFFGFILPRVHSASCICRCTSFTKFGMFLDIISSNIFPAYTLFPLSGTPVTGLQIFRCPLVPESARLTPLTLFSFFCSVSVISTDSVFNFPLSSVISSVLLSPPLRIFLLKWFYFTF